MIMGGESQARERDGAELRAQWESDQAGDRRAETVTSVSPGPRQTRSVNIGHHHSDTQWHSLTLWQEDEFSIQLLV